MVVKRDGMMFLPDYDTQAGRKKFQLISGVSRSQDRPSGQVHGAVAQDG
jgi:hypothetical protein